MNLRKHTKRERAAFAAFDAVAKERRARLRSWTVVRWPRAVFADVEARALAVQRELGRRR